jgi:hypothetical protein
MSQPTPEATPPINPYDSPETVRPVSGTSSGAKVLIGLGIGCGVLVLLCCGIGGIATFYFGRSFQQAMSKDPATVRQVAESIVTIDVPEELEPEVSIDFTLPFVNRKMMSMAVFADRGDHSALVLFQLDEGFGNADTMQAQFNQQIRESGRGQMEEINVEDSETIKQEINGEEAEFTVGKGKAKEGGREVWQATGGFKGKGGPAMLFVQVDAEKFTKEQVTDVIHSME